MKKLFLLILILVFLGGCAYEQRILKLENQMAGFKKPSSMLLAEQAGARKFWWRNALTGTDGLDGITGMVDGDAAIVVTLDSTPTATGYMYVYDENGTHSTSSPTRIISSGAAGCWHLVDWNATKVTTQAADGYRYINVTNSAGFNGTPNNGDCYYRQDNDSWCCYDGSAWDCVLLPDID